MQSKEAETFLGDGDKTVIKVTTIDEEKSFAAWKTIIAADDR